MTLYVPESLVIDITRLSGDIILLLPNKETLDIFTHSYKGIPEYSLIEWVINDVFPRGKNFIDIGAHIGTYTLTFGKKKIAPEIYSFECQKNTYNCLCANVAINNLENVTSHRVALGSPKQKGFGELRVISPDGGGSSICKLPTNADPLRVETVEIRTLDDFDISNIGLIKIDVEGNELNVLRGAIETIKRSNYPKILFEVWNTDWYLSDREKLFEFLRDLSYSIIPIRGYDHMFLAEKS